MSKPRAPITIVATASTIVLKTRRDANAIVDLVVEAQLTGPGGYIPADEYRRDMCDELLKIIGKTLSHMELLHFIEDFDVWDTTGDTRSRAQFAGRLATMHL